MNSSKKSKSAADNFKLRRENVEVLLKNYTREPGHKFPNSRREFLASGLITFSGSLIVPSLLTSISSIANAAESPECTKGESTLPAFVTLACDGGNVLGSAVLGRQKDGQRLSKYNAIGMGDTGAGGNNTNVETLMGVEVRSTNPIIKGIKEKATVSALAHTQLVSVVVRSLDDTIRNKMDPSGIIFNAGLKGKFITNVGTSNETPGRVRYETALSPAPIALQIESLDSFQNSVKFAGILGNLNKGLNTTQQQKLAKFVENLSNQQASVLAQTATTASNLTKLVKCATEQNTSLLQTTVAGLNGTKIPQLRTIWETTDVDAADFSNFDFDGTNSRAVMSSIVSVAMDGFAGPVGAMLGGFDYHGQDRVIADQRDQSLGRVIGRILSHAEFKGRAVCIYVNSDGACGTSSAANSDTMPWEGDDGSKGSMWAIFYDPKAKPELRTPAGVSASFQVGNWLQSADVDTSLFFGANPELAAGVIAANYLAFAGLESQAASLIGSAFDSSKLDFSIRTTKAASLS